MCIGQQAIPSLVKLPRKIVQLLAYYSHDIDRLSAAGTAAAARR
jgi:hypothetical protein